LNHLASIRKQQQFRGRRALGLFVAVWLNLVLQPCAMAWGVAADPDCMRCPPAEMQQHAGMHGNMDHKMPCVDGMADCAIVDALHHDGRSGELKLKDAPVEMPVAIAPHELTLPFQPPVDAITRPRCASVPAGTPPPLHVLHCVYLK
jgi:hypothetical protein